MTDSPKRKLSEHLRQRTKEWFRKADHELAYLDLSPFDQADPPTDTAGKMAHMVAEYALKAYLMLNKQPIEKSHDLVELLDACLAIRNDPNLENLRSDCQLLTQYRLDLVYPVATSPERITVEEAKTAIAKARQIRDVMLSKAEEIGYTHD